MDKPKNNKTIMILIIVIVFLLSVIGVLIYTFIFKDDIKQVKKEVEINKTAKLLDFVNNPRNDTIISKNKEIDTTTLGVQKLKIEYKNRNNKKNTFEFSIKVVDTTKPVIKCESVIKVPVNTTEIKIEVTDNSKEEIKAIIEGNYDLTKIGEYKVNIVAKDSSGNKSSKKVTIKVEAPTYKTTGYYSVKTDEAWYSIALRDNNYVEYEVNPCHGMGCGLFYMDGSYEVDGDKLTLTLDHNTDDTLEREESTEPTIMKLKIKDDNTIIFEEKELEFIYSDKQW